MDDIFTSGVQGSPEGSVLEGDTGFSSVPDPQDGQEEALSNAGLSPAPDGAFSSGADVLDGAEGEVQAYSLSVSDYGSLMVSSIPVGALLGAIFMIVGLTVLGIVKIFKKA